MSVLNQSGEEQAECPLCMEPLEVDDLHFYPCTCGYQICRFCWNRIREGENGLCPACRKAYPENPADFTPLSQEQVAAIKTEKKAREQRRRNKTLESRRALANVRVVQNNLVFVVGLPVRLADPEILKRQEYFGKYGKIHKVVINQSTTYAGSQGPSASAYVTYVSQADALRAIQSVNNVTIDGRVLKGSLGTTKYCANFMKNQPCPKGDCMYLHELGDQKASFTKEEMHQGLHQIYERKLHNALNAQTQKEAAAAAAAAAVAATKTGGSSGPSTNGEKHSSKEGNPPGFIPTTIVTSSNINIVNSNSKSKKDQSASSVSSGGSKEAWPSLGSSPPNSDSSSAGSKQASPKPQEVETETHATEMSQENGTSESNSPTQQSQSKHNREANSKSNRNKDQQNTNNNSKANRSSNSKTNVEQKNWNKQKSNSINDESDEDVKLKETPFEASHAFELDEFESDRHSLLDNHDLLDSSDHGLLEDDHSLLDDTNSDAMMMQRHREMLASLVDNNHMMGHQSRSNQMVDNFGLLDSYDRPSQGLLEQKELLMRERSRSEMLMRQNEMMARHHNLMQPKHYMPTSSHNIGLESASDLLGANFQNGSILPPFGMRLDGTVPNTVQNYGIVHNNTPLLTHLSGGHTGHLPGQLSAHNGQMGGHSGQLSTHNGQLSAHSGQLTGHSGQLTGLSGQLSGLSAQLSGLNQLTGHNGQILGHSGQLAGHSGHMSGHSGHLVGHSGMHQMAPTVNGFSEQQEGRYLGENMDKFFTDFHKTQQLKYLMSKGAESAPHPFVDSQHLLKFGRYAQPHNMMSAHQLEMEQKQRQAELAVGLGAAAGVAKRPAPVDDDLDFDPFKETQKAFAEMMESELQQNGLSPSESAERMRRARLPPPGFSHMNAFGLGVPRAQPAPPQPAQDWTQMDPAIMSTSVSFPPKPTIASPPELFQRFSQLGLQQRQAAPAYYPPGKLGWPLPPYPAGEQYSIPLPPGFSELAAAATGAECIESK